MYVLITGGRDHQVTPSELKEFLGLWVDLQGSVLGHGGARGVDRCVSTVITALGFEVIPYYVKTSLDGEWPAAGCRRNIRMIHDFNPDYLIAFPGGNGTKHCIDSVRKLVPACVVHYVGRVE